MANTTFVCGRCLHEAQGYSKTELEEEGWVWHAAGAASFIVCDECEALAKQRRRRPFAPPAPTHCGECRSQTMVVGPPNAVAGTPFNRALQTALCPVCDRYPELLYPRTEYEPGLLYAPT